MILGVKGIGQLIGSVIQMPLIDKYPLPKLIHFFFWLYTCVSVQIIVSFQCEDKIQIMISQFLCGMIGSIFYPVANTVLAKSSTSTNRTSVQINFVSLGTLAFSLGYLMVGLVFKLVNDEWDKNICLYVVTFGQSVQNLALVQMLFIDTQWQCCEDLAVKKGSVEEKLKSKLGTGFFNPVLIGVLAHKFLDQLESLCVKQQAIFFKELLYMGPFATQIVNFIAINIGALLSSLLMPQMCSKIGEAKVVTVIGFVALLLFSLFLILYHCESILITRTVWQCSVCMMFMAARGFTVCDLGVWKTITMDHTPYIHRGKWNIIDTVISGVTNIFIMACGVLSEQTGILALFQITCVIKLILALVNIPVQMMTRTKQERTDINNHTQIKATVEQKDKQACKTCNNDQINLQINQTNLRKHDLNDNLLEDQENYTINDNIYCCDSYDKKCHVQKRPVIE